MTVHAELTPAEAADRLACTHLDQIAVRELPASVEGCEDCLRRAASGYTSGSASHPIIHSRAPGEDWALRNPR